MKSIRIADDDYLGIIKSHIDCLASFEDIPNFNLLAPIGEFILKAMIMDCYTFGDRHPKNFTIMQDAENFIRSKTQYDNYRSQQQSPPYCYFQFSDLILLWNKGSGSNLWSIIHKINYDAYFRYFDFNQYRAFRNDTSHSNKTINKILTNKHYYMLLELFDSVITSHIGLSYPSIFNEYYDYFKKKILNKNNKKSIKFSKLKNENNYITFIDKLDLEKELALCKVNKFIPNIHFDLLPFSSSNIEPTGEYILLDYAEDDADGVACENAGVPFNSEVTTNTDEGFISGTLGWIKKLTKAGSLVADKFLADVKKRAEDGNAHFQNVHGVLHFHGSLVSKDLNEAFKWFVASASQGYAPAQLNLAKMYLKGFKVKVNYARAEEFFLKAANQGLLEAIEVLAVMHYFGEGVEKSPSLSEKWFVKAANIGSAKAQENLGIIYYKKGDYFKSVEYLAMAAKADVASAQNLLGVIYCTCDEVKNIVNAENMFKKAIKNDCITARINLGIFYYKYSQFNKGLKDIEKILKPLASDNAEAQFCLGVMHYKSGNFEEAAKWLEMAAKKEAKALYNLGTMYFNGEGYSKSIDDALRMYHKAADNYTLTNAYLSLGFIYYNGIKTQRLYEEAFEYFKLASDQESPLADKVLAKMYYYGIGTEIDFEQSHLRYKSAYAKGEHDAPEFTQLP